MTMAQVFNIIVVILLTSGVVAVVCMTLAWLAKYGGYIRTGFTGDFEEDER